MSRKNRISCVEQKDGSIDIVVPAGMAEEFKLMVKKGTNLAPDMDPEIRDFADRLFKRDHLMNGNMLQGLNKDIISSHWDIPAEDKYMLASGEQAQVVKKDTNLSSSQINAALKSICQGHPETCNCQQHNKD